MKAPVKKYKLVPGQEELFKLINRKKIRQWVKALETGGFRQANGTLIKKTLHANGDVEHYSYCCLGVAGEVCAKLTFSDMRHFGGLRNISKKLVGDLTDELGLNLKIQIGPGPLDHTELEDIFITLNDEQGRQFKTIARVIRRLLLGEDV